MLSRASSDAGTRLRRSKSSSTTQSHRALAPEPLDPDVAQQHALAAATTAFVRAHNSGGLERTKSHGSDLSRTKSNGSRKSQGSHFPQREPSLRSLRPKTAGKTFGASRKPQVSAGPSEAFPSFHVTPGTDNTLSTQPSISSNENMRPSSQPKPPRPSASSSIASQQIRKARSMYYASSIQTGSPLPRPPAKYLTTPSPISPAPDSSILSSRSAEDSVLSSRSAQGYPQRPRTTVVPPPAPPRVPLTAAPKEVVDRARDKYLQDFQQQRQVKHKPSLFLAPFKKRQDKGKKKGAQPASESRLSGNPVPIEATLDTTLVEFKPLKEKRSISDSLRNKFKKVFRRSSNKASVPTQHNEATREYCHDPTGGVGPAAPPPSHFDIPSPDSNTLQRVRSRSPSLEGGRPAFARPSSRGSTRSLHSEVSISNAATSRVTSWGSSSVGDTLTQRAIKRLTVIHEAKDSIGSETEHRQLIEASPLRKPPPLPGFAAFREPMPIDGLMESTSTPVDPKRVFSALMKEIDTAKSAQQQRNNTQRTPEDDNDVFVNNASREVHSSASVSACSTGQRGFRTSVSSEAIRPSSSKRSDHAAKSSSLKSIGRAFKSTIRTVTPADQRPRSSPVPDRTTSVKGAVRITRPTSLGSPESDISEGQSSPGEGGTLNSKSDPSTTLKGNTWFTPTREQIERRVQKSSSRWKAPLEESALPSPPTALKGPHGPGTSVSALSLPGSSKLEQDETMTPVVNNHLCVQDLQQYKCPAHPRSPKPKPVFSPLSPSVYSRNTDGVSILPNDSIMSLDEETHNAGDTTSVSGSAVIITSRSVKSYVIGTPSPQKEPASGHSSRDWKAWLSHEVSELGNLPNEEISIHNQYSVSSAHRREFTQISEGEDTVLVHDLNGSRMPDQASQKPKKPAKGDSPPQSFMSRESSRQSGIMPTNSSGSFGKGSPLSHSSPLLKSRRPSSNPSERSSFSRPPFEQRSSDRMNERFPFIDTGRRSSSNSAKFSRHTASLPGSRSSSSHTPSPKVYSDFSAPASNRTSKCNVALRGSKSAVLDGSKENRKENVTPFAIKAGRNMPVSQTSPSLERVGSLQPLAHPTWNRTTSILGQYTTSADSMRPNRSPAADTVAPQPRLRVHPMSPAKLTTRPKSAFDLRNKDSPPFTMSALVRGGSESPKKKDLFRSRPLQPTKRLSGRSLEGESLQSIIESPLVAKSNFGSRSPPQDSPLERRRPILHMKQSSSTLALNKEPSPGTECLGIDSLIDDGTTETPCDSRGGSVTPGQRMAERFLRERIVPSSAGSPALAATDERNFTPAFI